MNIFLNFLLVLILGACMACSSSAKLSKLEQEKLDPAIQKLVLGENTSDKKYQASRREDGIKIYSVIIKSTNPQELQDIGITPNTVTGEIIAARLSIKEIRQVVLLPSVKSVNNISKSYTN